MFGPPQPFTAFPVPRMLAPPFGAGGGWDSGSLGSGGGFVGDGASLLRVTADLLPAHGSVLALSMPRPLAPLALRAPGGAGGERPRG